MPGAGDTRLTSEAPQPWEWFGAVPGADSPPHDLSPTQTWSSAEPASALPPASHPVPQAPLPELIGDDFRDVTPKASASLSSEGLSPSPPSLSSMTQAGTGPRLR